MTVAQRGFYQWHLEIKKLRCVIKGRSKHHERESLRFMKQHEMGQTDSAFIIYELLHQEIKEKKMIIPVDHKTNINSKRDEKPIVILYQMFSENNGIKTSLSVVLLGVIWNVVLSSSLHSALTGIQLEGCWDGQENAQFILSVSQQLV